MASKDSNTVLTRREIGALFAGVMASSTQALSQTPASAASTASPGPALDLADWSYRWYGVERVTLARGTVCNGGQIYVEHWIPLQVRHPYPVILVYGGFRQSEIWISTPDGRRGWVSNLLEQGYKVYIVDKPGQGRNPYHPWVHGAFPNRGPNFEGTERNVVATATHTQWPGKGDPSEPEIRSRWLRRDSRWPITQSRKIYGGRAE